MLEYLLPSEDLDDLSIIQQLSSSIDEHNFSNLIKKYDLQDYIIVIIFKNKEEIKILSKIYFENSLKINNQKFLNSNLNDENNIESILIDLKEMYEDY